MEAVQGPGDGLRAVFTPCLFAQQRSCPQSLCMQRHIRPRPLLDPAPMPPPASPVRLQHIHMIQQHVLVPGPPESGKIGRQLEEPLAAGAGARVAPASSAAGAPGATRAPECAAAMRAQRGGGSRLGLGASIGQHGEVVAGSASLSLLPNLGRRAESRSITQVEQAPQLAHQPRAPQQRRQLLRHLPHLATAGARAAATKHNEEVKALGGPGRGCGARHGEASCSAIAPAMAGLDLLS
jgi:hypothetical protein